MKHQTALCLASGLLSCSYPNPDYEPGTPTGSATEGSAGTVGTVGTVGTGGTVGSVDATATNGGTLGTGGTVDTIDLVDTTDTDAPGDCEAGPAPGLVCHTLYELQALPDGCVAPPVLIEDINLDGYGDVLVACNSGSLFVYPGILAGLGARIDLGPAGDEPVDIVAGQLDGVNDVDFAVINRVSEGGVRLFYSEDNGIYTAYDHSPGNNPVAGTIGRWNDDESLDLAVALDGDQAVVLINNGVVTFENRPFTVPMGPRDLAMGDLDGDGDDDLAVVSDGEEGLHVLRNMGDLDPVPTTYADPGTGPTGLLINNIEPDDTQDILVTRGVMSGIRIFRGEGDGTFPMGDPEQLGLGMRLLGLDDGDFDDNGLPDAVFIDRDGEELLFLMLIESPNLADLFTMPLGDPPVRMSAGDIGGDGIEDVVVSFEGSTRVVVVLSG